MNARYTGSVVLLGDRLKRYAYCGNNPVMFYDPSEYIQEKYGDGYKAAGKTKAAELMIIFLMSMVAGKV